MISVCMATYNGESYLREQVDSILAQLGDQDELVISDDCSTDSTAEILKNYNDSRIKFFENRGQHGVVGNFENALNHSVGEYIFLSDQDDIWTEGKISHCLEVLQEADLVLHNALIIDKHGVTEGRDFFAIRGVAKGYIRNLIKNSYIGCCMAFKRSLLDWVLPFPSDIAMHDMWIGLRAELKGKVEFIQEPLILYRRHDTNASPTSGKSDLTLSSKLSYRIAMFRQTRKRS